MLSTRTTSGGVSVASEDTLAQCYKRRYINTALKKGENILHMRQQGYHDRSVFIHWPAQSERVWSQERSGTRTLAQTALGKGSIAQKACTLAASLSM